MKFLIVVLAVASLCLAEPEADPALLYNGLYSPYVYSPYVYAPYYVRPAVANSYAYSYPGATAVVNRLDKREAEADAQVLLAYPYASRYNYGPFYTTQACVTAEGCAVRSLQAHGLVKRDAEADPALFYSPLAYNSYYYPYLYRAAQVAPVVATVNKPVTYTHLGAHPVQPTTVVESQSAVVGHTLVRREAEAEADPAFYYSPLAYNSFYYPYLYRAAQVAPVVATVNNPVTYTHLGAHPVQPTTVVESHSAVVGHTLV